MKTLSIFMGLMGFVALLAACGASRLEQTPTTSETVPHTPTTGITMANTDTPHPATGVPPTAPAPDGRNLQPLLVETNIDLDEVVTLLPPGAIPAILPEQVEKIMVTAAEAEQAGLDSTTRVLGVSINGDSRAYPIPYMSAHEIVNDEVGGQLIADTW